MNDQLLGARTVEYFWVHDRTILNVVDFYSVEDAERWLRIHKDGMQGVAVLWKRTTTLEEA